MKKRAAAILTMAAITAGLLASETTFLADETIEVDKATYTASGYLAAGDVTYEYLTDKVLQDVTDATGGAIQFNQFYGAELVGPDDQYEALMDGTVDVVPCPLSDSETSDFPLLQISALPVWNASYDNVEAGFLKLMDPDSETELTDGMNTYDWTFTRKGVKGWPTAPNTTGAIYIKGKSLADAATYATGTTIRTAGVTASMIVEKMGMTPTVIALAEVTDALSKGTVDGLVFTYNILIYGIEPYVDQVMTGTNMGGGSNWMAVRTDWWDELPDAVKDVWQASFDENYPLMGDAVWQVAEDEFDYYSNNGIEMLNYDDLDDDIKEIWDNAYVQAWYQWIDSFEAEGVPAKNAAIIWRDILTEEGVDFPEEIQNLESYEVGSAS